MSCCLAAARVSEDYKNTLTIFICLYLVSDPLDIIKYWNMYPVLKGQLRAQNAILILALASQHTL